ncbi:MAG: SDR family NAD(P)-dependent oxidoreductase [Nitrospiraceae bacterium]
MAQRSDPAASRLPKREPPPAPIPGGRAHAPRPGRLAHKVAIITGASRGIGRATAELFAREGARVVLCARTRRELLAARDAIRAAGGLAEARVTDISSARQARALIRFAVECYGRLDLLINNAGILGPRRPLIDYPQQKWNQVLRINLTGTFYVTQAASRIMAAQRGGCIITISSSVGRAGRAEWGAYAVSKFGVEGLMQVLADELRSVRVIALTFNPGATRTAMRAEAYPKEDPTGLRTPSVPAEALLRLATHSSAEMSGQAFDLDHLP